MILTDEIGGQVYPVGEVRLHKPVITVRELIAARVDLELEAHLATRNGDASGISRDELRLNGEDKALRPSLFAACRGRAPPAREMMIEAAEQGFLRNRFFILLDDRQAEHLEDELDLDRTGNVTFLQLTQLQGG